MYIRIIAFIMTVIFTASAFAGMSVLTADCMDHPCCCHSPAMSSHKAKTAMIRSVNGCCCQPAGEMPCTLTNSLLSGKDAFVLIPKRTQAPVPNTSNTVDIAATPDTPKIDFAPLIANQALVSDSPPIYQSIMSFLC
jgi:hypothetical protein